LTPNPLSDSRPTLDRWFAAWNARAVRVLLELAHPHIEVVPRAGLTPPGTSYHGHEGLETMMRHTSAAFPRARWQPREYRQVGGWIEVRARFKPDGFDGPGDDARVALFSLERGRVRRLLSFRNEEQALAALGTPQPALTRREREVFQLLAHGYNAPQIAERLYLSPATVRTHVQNAVASLGARTRVHAIARAIARGEIDP
jgi:DNA-binding CsgD family transcriptional regulator